MKFIRQFFPWAALLTLILSGCTLLEGPQRPVIPTPPATAPPIDASFTLGGELVTDPVSSVVPTVDPEIASLLNEVSQQQLTGYVQTLTNFGTRNAFSATDRMDFGVGAARLFIFNEFSRVGNGRLKIRFQDFPLNFEGRFANQQNVIATLPGTGPNPNIIVIMAHYDTRPVSATDGVSRSPGADDNASGVALLLETARILSARQWNQTVVFAAIAAEEQGTFGSRFFVQETYLNNVDVLAAVNYDIVGGRPGIPQSIRLFAPDLLTSPSGELARYYDFTSGMYVPTFPLTIVDALDRNGRFGDHREFVKANMPAVRLTESVENPDLLNSVRDTWDLIDYNYLRQVVQITIAMLGNALGAPPPPPVPTIAPMADPGSYLLTWLPDPNVAGYAISFRPLDSPTFAPFRFVSGRQAGNVALTDLEPNVVYAVSMAAVDENGRISLFSPEIIVEPTR